jgi:hypothetical protein
MSPKQPTRIQTTGLFFLAAGAAWAAGWGGMEDADETEAGCGEIEVPHCSQNCPWTDEPQLVQKGILPSTFLNTTLVEHLGQAVSSEDCQFRKF